MVAGLAGVSIGIIFMSFSVVLGPFIVSNK